LHHYPIKVQYFLHNLVLKELIKFLNKIINYNMLMDLDVKM